MNWIRTDCFDASNNHNHSNSTSNGSDSDGSSIPTSSNNKESNNDYIEQDDLCRPRKARCPLHKPIRNRRWSDALRIMRFDPSQICKTNLYGWSSLTLAIYHRAPMSVVSEMLALLHPKDMQSVLATPIPNGSRLCLHFAARYIDDLDVIRLLTEAYPHGLLIPSDDGVLPVDRAIYYRKDAHILHYLEQATKKQRNFENIKAYNLNLRYCVLMSCSSYSHHEAKFQMSNTIRNDVVDDNDVNDNDNDDDIHPRKTDVSLAPDLYHYCQEREMMGIFWNMLSYIGVDSIP